MYKKFITYQWKFTYSAWGPFTQNKERIQKFKQTGDTDYIYKTFTCWKWIEKAKNFWFERILRKMVHKII